MRILIILLFLLISIYSSFGQNPEYYRVKRNTKKVVITPYSNSEIVILSLTGVFRNARKIIYHDTINGYQAEIPKSMEIQETNSLYNFCYTIPRDNGNDNVICVNSVPKDNFESFERFKNHIIENPEYLEENSKSWLWGEKSKILSINNDSFDSYHSYKVKVQVNKRKVLGQFILLETDKSYLWINFVADEDTFDSDIGKFSKFMKKFQLIE